MQKTFHKLMAEDFLWARMLLFLESMLQSYVYYVCHLNVPSTSSAWLCKGMSADRFDTAQTPLLVKLGKEIAFKNVMSWTGL